MIRVLLLSARAVPKLAPIWPLRPGVSASIMPVAIWSWKVAVPVAVVVPWAANCRALVSMEVLKLNETAESSSLALMTSSVAMVLRSVVSGACVSMMMVRGVEAGLSTPVTV